MANAIQAFDKRLSRLRSQRQSWEAHWKELSEYIMPRRGRFLSSDHNKGDKRNKSIIDNTSVTAMRTLSSGMMSGVTSPARPWFRLTVSDESLMNNGAVRDWLYDVEKIMQMIFARSNLYNALPMMYDEMGCFGTAALFVSEDYNDVINCQTLTVGEYWLGTGKNGAVDTLYREWQMTVGQVVSQFGIENVSNSTRDDFNKGNVDGWVTVIHAVEPNTRRDIQLKDNKNMPFISVHYEKGRHEGKFLKESGFEEFPAMCPRWHVTSNDIYGRSPAMDALGDIKQLQVAQKRKAQAIDKMVNPPMVAPAHLENKAASLLPGGVTYVDSTQGQQGFAPAYQVQPRLGEFAQDIQETQDRINRTFYADLFLMLSMSNRRQITAREIDERHEEKLLMLGSVLERLNDELLDPLINRTFAIMSRTGNIPEPPEALQGIDLKVEYVSVLAQAQKMVDTGTIERAVGFVGQVSEIYPEALDKFNADKAIDEYTAMLGVPPNTIRDENEVASIREGKQRAAANAQAMEQMQATAQAASTLGNTSLEGDNVLTRVMGDQQ